MLQVLVGKTMEQALLEVLEEEELARLRAQQRAFQELRNAELVEVQRLEEQERRHREEKVEGSFLEKNMVNRQLFWRDLYTGVVQNKNDMTALYKLSTNMTCYFKCRKGGLSSKGRS